MERSKRTGDKKCQKNKMRKVTADNYEVFQKLIETSQSIEKETSH